MTTPVPQPVITVADYVDGILTGVAHFDGEPHVFLATKGKLGESCTYYELYPIAEVDPTFVLEPQELWNPQNSVRDLIASLVAPGRAGRVVVGEFRPVGTGSSRSSE